MKNQALYSSEDKSKKLKCCLLQFLFAALRVKYTCEAAKANFSRPTTYLLLAFNVSSCLAPSNDLKELISSR